LLSRSGTTEKSWQQFFAAHPYVLSESLPLRIEPQDIQALARPGLTEPDFIFYPRALQPIPFCGVIELKRPDSKIITIPRKNVAMLSRDAQTAARQGMQYAVQLRQEVIRQDQIRDNGNDKRNRQKALATTCIVK
jgi:Shedu protein SduA, C-terminal